METFLNFACAVLLISMIILFLLLFVIGVFIVLQAFRDAVVYIKEYFKK